MVAVVGRANVGKSSLVNALLGEKVSIVSAVAQTTRNMIRGMLTEPRGQIVFVDTPGVHRAGSELGKLMNRMARNAVEGVDVVLLVLDGSERPQLEDEGWMSRLMFADVTVIACLNKADLGANHEAAYRDLWAARALEKKVAKEPVWVRVSAQSGEGLAALQERLLGLMPEGPLLFPDDILTDYPRKLNMADVIREKLFADLRDEVPHAVAVWVENIEESPEGWRVEAAIYVNKSSQKGIVLGEKGRRLRKAKRKAESELSEMYGHPVAIELWVKVEKDWSRNFWMLKKLGYVS
jgi:GTP-binding protein Era